MARRTVLVVEDSDDLRSVFCDALTMAGFAVRGARDGLEALRIVDSAPPDVIILDIGLPRVSGHDVLHELKQHAHTRVIPVIVVTGSRENFSGVTPDCVLRKPVALPDLVQKVHNCLLEHL